MNRKEHWQKVYRDNPSNGVSWFQEKPLVSLNFLHELKVEKDAAIIDVGGGDSNLVDYLLEEGYTDITVLDISQNALEKSKLRLGEKANKINWIVSDVTSFVSARKFDLWHDRAVLHFLTNENEVEQYFIAANNNLNDLGKMVLGTFSTEGPDKCSGLPVKRYNQDSITNRARKFFKKIKCITAEHLTPINRIQQFLFCSFLKSPIQYGNS
jgi:2-polyprenyl-3-methyl-5-hydroxy-6-metoxy-1,4-benzoquinol methylase